MTHRISKSAALFIALVVIPSCGDWPRISEILREHHGREGHHRDAGAPGPGGAGGQACWAGRLPALKARPPTRPAAESCGAILGGVAWSEPSRGTEPSVDASELFVGRWITCGRGGLGMAAHDGIEFGANRRWRLLARNATGDLVPVPATSEGATGRYYALSRGQINVSGEGFEGTKAAFFGFDPDKDLVRFVPTQDLPGGLAAIYARAVPSALMGSDNPPSISDGRCSMVGTWDLAATEASPSASFSFDSAGNFVGGPLGSDLCAAHTMYGTYRLSPGLFQLTSNVGMGQCAWWFDAGYPATFDTRCDQVRLVQQIDNCTGGRGYFNGETLLTRRR